jgi:hypothetical protein
MNPPRETPNVSFWDLDPRDRAAAYDRACELGNVNDFHDLSPEERLRAYEKATEGFQDE